MRNASVIRAGLPWAGLVAALLVAVCLTTGCKPAMGEKKTPDTSGRPNVIFILTDDLDTKSISHMPNLHSLLMDEGTTFSNAFVTDPLCCPSRATILRGQYAHNHGILGNEPPWGGSKKFHELGHENSTVATWMSKEKYQTVFIGKYLNGYGYGAHEKLYVPPGWDEWHGLSSNYLNIRVNENGQIRTYDPRTHNSTDMFSGKADDYIQRAVGDNAPLLSNGEPFFMWLGTQDPHEPANPADRYKDDFSRTQLPRSPSFDEKDISDKPEWLRDNPPLKAEDISKMQGLYRNRLRSMLAVDAMIGNLVRDLREAGELDDTYIFFTSDNGFHMGEHRMTWGKWTPYEEDIRVPLVVRGPGVPAGRKLDHLVLNNDLAPTLADIAGADKPSFVDGRSLMPLLKKNPPPPRDWRQSFLIEGIFETSGDLISPGLFLTGDPPPDNWRQKIRTNGKQIAREWGRPGFQAVRTGDHLYVEYETGERELYDLGKDPHELDNIYPNADPRLLKNLKARLDTLGECYGSYCKTAENSGEGKYPNQKTNRAKPRASSQPEDGKTAGKRQ